MATLVELKEFVADRPEAALLAISLLANAVLFSLLLRSHAREVKTLMTLLPLATRMTDMFAAAVAKAKNRGYACSMTPTPFSSSGSPPPFVPPAPKSGDSP